jgi:hypothetical protein
MPFYGLFDGNLNKRNEERIRKIKDLFIRRSTQKFYDAHEILSHPLKDLSSKNNDWNEIFYDAQEILSYPLYLIEKDQIIRRKWEFDEMKKDQEINFPKSAIRFQEESYVRKTFHFMGPELHIHLGIKDVRRIMDLYKQEDRGKEVTDVIVEMTDALLRLGFKKEDLIHAAHMSGYDSYVDHARAMIKTGILDYYDVAKNKNGSIDIYQPGILLISPIKKTRVGNKWFNLPTNEMKAKM